MPRYSLNQHKAQAFHASRAIDREAQRIAEGLAVQREAALLSESGLSMNEALAAVAANPELLAKCRAAIPEMLNEAYAAVFDNPDLLAKCHAEAPKMSGLSVTWSDPSNDPSSK